MTELPEPLPPAPPAPPPAPPPEPVPAGWEGIIQPGERILWQGRPQRGIVLSELFQIQTLMGVFFVVFSVFWISQAASMASHRSVGGVISSIFPLFGLPFLGIGLYMAGGRLFWRAHVRGRTHYTLTDAHAFIATETLGRRELDRHALFVGMPLTLDDGSPGNLWFAERVVHHPAGYRGHGKDRRWRPAQTVRQRIGFERIADARQVYALLRDASHRLAEQPGKTDSTP